ncbi:MAG: hypothetical protein OHK0012_22370 [Synechococcales cyanobacterium]
MGHPWWQRLGLGIPVLGFLMSSGCMTPTSATVTIHNSSPTLSLGLTVEERDFAAGVLSRELTGDLDVYGFLQVGLNPEIGMTVWGGVGGPNAVGVDLLSLPKIGLNLYLRGELYPEPDEIAVTVVSPQDGATLDTNQPVTFNANAVGNPQLKLKAGVELTLRDGSVEENSCLIDSEEQNRHVERVNYLERSLDNCPPNLTKDPNRAQIATRDYRARKFCKGGRIFSLQRPRLIYTLERHHPEFHNPQQLNTRTSFFRSSTSIPDILNIIDQVFDQNLENIRSLKDNESWEYKGNIIGVNYKVHGYGERIMSAFPENDQLGICTFP